MIGAAPVAARDGGVRVADGLRDVVSDNRAAAGVIETLDRFALSIGSVRISAWDCIVAGLVLLTVILVAWFASKLARRALRKATRLDATQRLLGEKLVSIAVWAVALLIGIDVLGIDLTALAVFSGAFGLAIGFGLQKTFGNLIAGIILLMDRSIKPGDVIAVTDMAGNESFGQIRKIGIRAISIVTRDKKEYLIPNENLMVNQVENWSYSSRDVRVKAPVRVAYGSDLELVERLLCEAAVGTPRVLDRHPPTVRLMEFAESAILFEIRFWIEDPEEGVNAVRSDVYKRVWRLFQDNAIEMPFPHRDIRIRDAGQFRKLVGEIAGVDLPEE